MLSDPRSISYVLECVHPPLRHDQAQLKQLYARTSADPRLAYGNFNSGAMGARMMTVHGPASFPNAQSHSIFAILPDRFQLTEEWPAIGIEDFIDKAKAASALVLEELPVTRFAAIQCVVRSLASVPGVDDCRAWLEDRFQGPRADEAACFGREPALFGLRLGFGPSMGDATLHNVRVESFNGDRRSLFLEDAGILTLQEEPADPVAVIESAVRGVYDFLTGPVIDWLNGRA
ncbi:MAG: hypothetical protein H6807_03350 [Planctomycetes bacterium]|nr:hypothetical protein [Planctomycetota bacterium]